MSWGAKSIEAATSPLSHPSSRSKGGNRQEDKRVLSQEICLFIQERSLLSFYLSPIPPPPSISLCPLVLLPLGLIDGTEYMWMHAPWPVGRKTGHLTDIHQHSPLGKPRRSTTLTSGDLHQMPDKTVPSAGVPGVGRQAAAEQPLNLCTWPQDFQARKSGLIKITACFYNPKRIEQQKFILKHLYLPL